MHTRLRSLTIAGALALLVGCVVGAVALALALSEHGRAERRWSSQRPRHYSFEVEWQNGWSFGSARVEVRDGALVAATDRATGGPLAVQMVAGARYFGSIDTLFTIIDERVKPKWEWRNLLARYAPDIARRFDPCVAPLSKVSYDPTYGFPSDLWYNDSWCAATFFNYSHVRITAFQALP